MANNCEPGFLYVLQPREFLLHNTDVYKVGRTKNIKQRLDSYPTGAVFIAAARVQDTVGAERALLQLLKTIETCTLWSTRGRELFEGPMLTIVEAMYKVANYKEYAVSRVEAMCDVANCKVDSSVPHGEALYKVGPNSVPRADDPIETWVKETFEQTHSMHDRFPKTSMYRLYCDALGETDTKPSCRAFGKAVKAVLSLEEYKSNGIVYFLGIKRRASEPREIRP
jgi:hypothetical protein